jgi:hypothetical protein
VESLGSSTVADVQQQQQQQQPDAILLCSVLTEEEEESSPPTRLPPGDLCRPNLEWFATAYCKLGEFLCSLLPCTVYIYINY